MRVKRLTSPTLVAAFWIVVIGAELWLLLNDINVLSSPRGYGSGAHLGPAIALIAKSSNAVQVQNPGELVWAEGKTGSALHDGQSLLTLENSRAVVQFKDESELSVSENSLVKISTPQASGTGNEIKLSVLRGEVRSVLKKLTAARPKPVVLEIGVAGKTAKLVNTTGEDVEFVLRAPPPQPAQAKPVPEGTEKPAPPSAPFIEVTSGKLELETDAGQIIAIESGERLMLPEQASAELKVEKISTEAVPSPSAASAIEAEPSPLVSPVASSAPAPSPTPEVSASAPVEKPASATKPRARKLPPPKLSNPPKIRKRAKPSPAPGAFLRPSIWDRIFPRAHAAESPKPQASAAGTYDDEIWEIELSWTPVKRAKSYRIQIAKDRGFTNIVVDDTSSAATYVWNYRFGMENSKGRVFYRVATTNEDGKSGRFSAPETITLPKKEVLIAQKIEEKKAPPPPPPLPAPKPVPLVLKGDRWSVGVGAGMSSFAQTSDERNLEEVSSGLSPREAVTAKYHRIREKRLLSFQARFDPGHFEGGARHATQTEVKAYSLSLLGLKGNAELYQQGRLAFVWGLSADHAYRFEKASLTTLDVAGGWSAGLAGGFMQHSARARGLAPDEFSLLVSAPVTGLLLDAQYGARLESSLGWRFGAARRFGMTFRLAGDYLKFDEPSGTTVTGYGAALLFTAHFDQERR